jgi:ketosteroid isomerase-like protein
MLTPEQRRNIEMVHAFYECERKGDLEGWSALWHPEGSQTFPWGDGSNNVIGLDALRASTARKFQTRSNVSIAEQLFAMADPRWVFAITRVSVHFTDLGRTLNAELWCRFHFDEQGLLLEHQEVLDGTLIARLLDGGEFGLSAARLADR